MEELERSLLHSPAGWCDCASGTARLTLAFGIRRSGSDVVRTGRGLDAWAMRTRAIRDGDYFPRRCCGLRFKASENGPAKECKANPDLASYSELCPLVADKRT